MGIIGSADLADRPQIVVAVGILPAVLGILPGAFDNTPRSNIVFYLCLTRIFSDVGRQRALPAQTRK